MARSGGKAPGGRQGAKENIRFVPCTLDTDGFFALLDEPFRGWFRERFGAPTLPQCGAVPVIRKGRNVLVASPTGTGKTLSFFTAVLDELFGLARRDALPDGIHTLYISPIRALGYDIRKNLMEPLEEVARLDREDASRIRVGMRSGDTSQKERREHARLPRHLFITTPESLAMLLVQPEYQRQFRTLRYVIVDEIHSLFDNKRGTHLALTLERLERFTEQPPVRIGGSATIEPLEEVARFLVGAGRPCSMVDARSAVDIEVKVESPIRNHPYPKSGQVTKAAIDRLAAIVRRNRTTLIFTNTRSAVERVTERLRKRLPEDFGIEAHHSSLEREHRLRVEDELKEGRLRAVVASSSLELGIDIGTIDEVVLLNAPRGVNRCLQRIGRAGHGVGQTSRGILLPTNIVDLVECALTAERVRAGDLDPLHPISNALDVLAQHVTGIAAEREETPLDDAFAMVIRAHPYRNLSRADFDAVVGYLAGARGDLTEEKVFPRIAVEHGSLRPLPSTRMIYTQNVGAIASEGSVKVKPYGSKPGAEGRLGRIGEGFVAKMKKGDTFLLGGRVWEFGHTQGMTLFVKPGHGVPNTPQWAGSPLSLESRLAESMERLRGELHQFFRDGAPAAKGRRKKSAVPADPTSEAVRWLEEIYRLDDGNARAIAEYFHAQSLFSAIPTADDILIERQPDGRRQHWIFHTVAGRPVNDATGRLIAHRIARETGRNAMLTADDYGILLTVPSSALLDEKRVREWLAPESFRDDLLEALERSEYLKRRFRFVAEIGFLVVRNFKGFRKVLGGLQWNSQRLYSVLRETDPDFPLLRETYRTVLEDDLDIAAMERRLREYLKRRIRIVDVPSPSPFGISLHLTSMREGLGYEESESLVERLFGQVEQRIREAANP